jgi:hypothetical protein
MENFEENLNKVPWETDVPTLEDIIENYDETESVGEPRRKGFTPWLR